MRYFVNYRTGELLKSPTRPSGNDWHEITELQYSLYLLVTMEYCRQQIQDNLMD